MKIINPATEEIIKEIQTDTSSIINEKYQKLKEGQKQWQKTPLDQRIAYIIRFGEIVKQNIDELAHLLTNEVGKPITQSYGEIKGAHGRIDFFSKHAGQWLQDEWMVKEGGTQEKISFEPLGVIANISAWNYPYNVGYNVFLPALIAGNAVLYKPSEYTSLTGLKFKELLWQAGIPKNVFECVVGSAEAGKTLLELPLDGYFFTGSYATGKFIAQSVAHKLVPLQLELGGKDPLYVADDVADIEKVAASAAEGAFYNTGQSCCAVERIYVHHNVYDKFVEAFVKEVHSYKMGDPTQKDVFIGPLTRHQQMEVLNEQIKDALNKDARLVAGGKKANMKGFYFEPAILLNVNHTMKVMRDESFGPVIGIQKVKDDEEALALMQDTEYGLTAAIYSSDFNRAQKLMQQLNTGTVYWNCCDRVSPNVPWSGRKHSGLGSTLSYLGIRAFVKPKAYHLRP
jgi:acyl-CoA reductase-like NAD-dependent aldehyde dehydrogenase